MVLGAYGWAYIKPIRTLYYNMSISIEALGLIAGQWSSRVISGGVIASLNDSVGTLGYIIIRNTAYPMWERACPR